MTDLWQAFQTINAHRRAVRDFDGSAIPAEDIRAIVAEASLAPTSINLQPYQIHWVRNPEQKALLAKACNNQKAATTASELLVITASPQIARQSALFLQEYVNTTGELSEKSKDHYRGILKTILPGLMLMPLPIWTLLLSLATWFVPSLGLFPLGTAGVRHWTARSAIFVAQNLMLAASAKGLDTCPMEGFSPAKVSRLLKLPYGTVIPVIVAVGKRTPTAHIEPRWRKDAKATLVEYV